MFMLTIITSLVHRTIAHSYCLPALHPLPYCIVVSVATWFIAVQGLMTVGLCVALVALLIATMALCCQWHILYMLYCFSYSMVHSCTGPDGSRSLRGIGGPSECHSSHVFTSGTSFTCCIVSLTAWFISVQGLMAVGLCVALMALLIAKIALCWQCHILYMLCCFSYSMVHSCTGPDGSGPVCSIDGPSDCQNSTVLTVSHPLHVVLFLLQHGS